MRGRITDIGPVLDPNIRTAKVRIEIANPGILRLGMFVSAAFESREKHTFAVVPAAAKTVTVDNLPASVFQLQRHGYLMMDRTKDGWLGTVFSMNDTILGACRFAGCEASCLLSPTLPAQLPATVTHERSAPLEPKSGSNGAP